MTISRIKCCLIRLAIELCGVISLYEFKDVSILTINTLRPIQNCCHFADDIFKCIFMNENAWIPIMVSLKCVLKGPINFIFNFNEFKDVSILTINTLRPIQNCCHFADDIFICIFMNENAWIPIMVSLKCVLKGPINFITALIKIMAWFWLGDKPISEPLRAYINDADMRNSASLS